MSHMAIENPGSVVSLLGRIALAVSLFACHRVSGSTMVPDSLSDSGIYTAMSVKDASGRAGTVESRPIISEYCTCVADDCCRAEPNASVFTESETPIRGEVVNLIWTLETDTPMCAEAMLCRPVGRLPWGTEYRSLDQVHLERYWKRYVAIRSSARIKHYPLDLPRVAVVFTSNIGGIHWVSFGPGPQLMETDDRVCHAVDGALFRDVVGLLDLHSTIAHFSPEYGNYL
jgi:hypothetical protein